MAESASIEGRDPITHGQRIGIDLPPDFPESINLIVADASHRANAYVGSTAARDLLEPSQRWEGVEWWSTDDGRTYRWTGSGWQRKYRRGSTTASRGNNSTILTPPGQQPPVAGAPIGEVVIGSVSLSGEACVVEVFAAVNLWLPFDSAYNGSLTLKLDGQMVDQYFYQSRGHGGRMPVLLDTDADLSRGSHTLSVVLSSDMYSASPFEVNDSFVHFRATAA